MLTKFISVSETHFQNTEIALKNQQASIQELETKIGQLAKLISERPQGSLPSNTDSNPMEQLNAITSQDEEGLVTPVPEPRQETKISKEKKPNLEEMLTKFISVSETHFQNTEIALKNQQASIQELETKIGQLAKLISERPQGSLPSNTDSNPMEQLNAITSQDEEGLVTPVPEPRQETKISKGTGEVDHNEQKRLNIE
ncbi:hypothetical protein GOBAR_AA20352 [Gossypium barbadense]|uniref:Uncharacterized protein n=1 Tax=Gossypium barbadense TaxID=3634 RepID=A0A2P5XAD7_GOSBA|nr:hypothetical protein GOBAR_AA20352 [Gossypium barbadense]